MNRTPARKAKTGLLKHLLHWTWMKLARGIEKGYGSLCHLERTRKSEQVSKQVEELVMLRRVRHRVGQRYGKEIRVHTYFRWGSKLILKLTRDYMLPKHRGKRYLQNFQRGNAVNLLKLFSLPTTPREP